MHNIKIKDIIKYNDTAKLNTVCIIINNTFIITIIGIMFASC